MEDRSLKYSEASIRLIIEDLKRDYEKQKTKLQQNHKESMLQWKDAPGLSGAFEAAYQDEMDQLKSKFNSKLKEVQEEVNSLVKVSSERFLSHLDTLQVKIKEVFRFINQSAISVLSLLLLRSEDFF